MNKTRGLWHGKRLDNGEWIIGYLMRRQGAMSMTFSYIMPAEKSEFDFNEDHVATGDEWIPVETKTLGECIGLTDKNGKSIFEGDIVKFRDWHKGLWCWIGAVHYENQGFVVSGGPNEECDTPFTVSMSGFASKSIEVIGNVYDNPELAHWKDGENDG